MYRSSSTNYIRSENPVYRWGYLSKSTSPIIKRFNVLARLPQSEWCSTLWGRTNEAIAPPKGALQCQTT